MHVAVKLTRTGGPDPPYDHNFKLGSAVYDRLQQVSKDAADILHDSHQRSAYVLSEIHRVKGKAKEAWFRVGTSSPRVAELVAQALTPGTEITIQAKETTRFQITGLEMEEPVVRPGEYVTLSPILLTDRETDQSLVHDSEGYNATLETAINNQIENNAKMEGKTRLLHLEHQAVRKRTINGRTFLTQKARLLLDGPEEELRFLVDHGIGRSPALGFGMVVPGD